MRVVFLEGALAFPGRSDRIIDIDTSHALASRYEPYYTQYGVAPVDVTEFLLS